MKLVTPVAWRFQTARLSSRLHEFSLCKNCCWLEQAGIGKHCGHCKLDRYCIFISCRQSATRGYRPPTHRQPQQKTFYPAFTPFKVQVLFCIALSQFHREIPPPPHPRTSCFWRWLSWWYLQHSSGCSSLLIGLLFLMCWSLRICLALFIFCFSVVLGSFRVEQQQGSSHLLPYT